MSRRNIYLGDRPLKTNQAPVEGTFTELDGERFYKISNVDRMPDFFINLVSASDQWMFISSNGSLSAGRKNPEGALFPYYSEDKIHDYRGKTGSKTLILLAEDEKMKLWEPFTGTPGIYSTKRNLYKNLPGNKLIFEEINEDLGLVFRYGWYNSQDFGFVKSSVLINTEHRSRQVELLDGLQNILPSFVNSGLQLSSSNLLDAYKRHELIAGTTLGIYRLSSVPTDAAEPSEALRVNSVWSEGLPESKILLSVNQLDRFISGNPIEPETDIKACRGAYFVNASLELRAGGEHRWSMVAEVNQDITALTRLINLLTSEKAPAELVYKDVDRGTADLLFLLASADALQCTTDELSTTRHLSNVLFNIMRGGVFSDHAGINTRDFLEYVKGASTALVQEAESLVDSLPSPIQYHEMLERARLKHSPALLRQCCEYLPLTFSRRHGDPSRPWNRFSIENRKEDGSRKLDFQGNWRDIFQNWEALSYSFPAYVEGMISKFVNASTADGYNPYRITRGGIDWEVPDPSDPWSNIGYWGDHQIIYLLKLLEISANHHPDRLHDLLFREIFSYANVPYRIKPYRDLLKDPHNTILFDRALEDRIQRRVADTGSDGRMVWDKHGQVFLVNLTEKLLVTLLTKLSNFIPGAGIWMNTQRPEWNDANNALVGYGVSMVTACHLRAFTHFCRQIFENLPKGSVGISSEVADFFSGINEALEVLMQEPSLLLTAMGMKRCMDAFGEAGSAYRMGYYKEAFSGEKTEMKVDRLLIFFDRALDMLDQTIRSNKREDGLYHAYNLIRVEGDQVLLRRLYEMLEGQVAVLSSGFLSPEEALALLDALKKSKLFREDQYSYILYPDRNLPGFLEKNIIPRGELEGSDLLQTLLKDSDSSIVEKDVEGVCHFNGDFRNATYLKEALDRLPETYSRLVEKEKEQVLAIYEKLFDHQSFTGRSGTFYGYEGLGSIYWHMVSKLLLAVCESIFRAAEAGSSEDLLSRLADHFYEIRAGIGLNKSPEVYGAFPTDPYSHTPGNKGAQQPGMTGQVKEDIIARWGELGVHIRDGRIYFLPLLLRKEEFFRGRRTFHYLDLDGMERDLELEKETLAFTYCQVPVIYHASEKQKIVMQFNNGRDELITGNSLGKDHSEMIFRRSGEITRMDVWLTPAL